MPGIRPTHHSLRFPCLSPGCMHWFQNASGCTQHMHACHPVALTQDFLPTPPQSPPPPDFSPPPPDVVPLDDDGDPESEFMDASGRYYRTYHLLINGLPCTADGVFLLPGTPPTPAPLESPHDWSPYCSDVEFAMAEFTFKQCHMSNKASDILFDLMAAQLSKHNDSPPFADHKDLHKVIDATQLGNVPWQCLSVQYMGERPEHNTPPWMGKDYEVWYRDPHMMAHNMLANTTYKDFMSGDWAWQQAICIRCISYNSGHTNIYQDELSKDLNTHGSMFIPIILGSDKTTVSVGMGNNEYYPLYASIGNVHNNVQCTHCNALVIIGFLSIPKTDYEEQLVLSCTIKNWCLKCLAHQGDLDGGGIPCTREHTDLLPFTNDFPRANIHQLISFGLLHQLVTGAFKDHLVDWVLKYLKLTHGTKRGEEIMSDIDCRIAAVASFTGLQRFPDSRSFKQWTGNDSKALMKVFILAIEGHVPQDMVQAFLKEPWWWSNKHNALGQMLLTNQQLDKLAASCQDFAAHGMLVSSVLSRAMAALAVGPEDEPNTLVIAPEVEEQKCIWTVAELVDEVNVPHLQHFIWYFLFSQLFPNNPCNLEDVPAASCPWHEGGLYVFNSAAATFYAPSDPSGVSSMQRKQIQACPLWQNVSPHNDYLEGMKGLEVARWFDKSVQVFMTMAPQTLPSSISTQFTVQHT
ncbi:hypothetical protein BDR06DRAFT_974481 [Suillus hirtellus]|nr:hypothetical protein BDR06DRAFT_974481 [Suillus hirtellus]